MTRCECERLEYQVGRFTGAPTWRCAECGVAHVLDCDDLECYEITRDGDAVRAVLS